MSNPGLLPYQERFFAYQEIYTNSCPTPVAPPPGANVGAQKAALKRKFRYNDKKTTQNLKVKGVKNGNK